MLSSSKAGGNGDGEHLVCVTGAGSFIGSWVVKELLLRGYHVRGTARDPAHRKNAHLLAMDGAGERLNLCRADVMDGNSLRAAFHGCRGVFHVASPVSNDPELVPEAVEGTRNVINAAADAGVGPVVFTSSYGAVHMDPNRSPDTIVDETSWSDYGYCKQTGNLHCCAKMMAEVAATEEAARRGLELAVVVVVPATTIGPALQQTLNFSSDHVARCLTGAKPAYQNTVTAYVDVQDVARAHALVYEHPDACGHRYLCVAAVLHRAHFLRLLRDLFPQYPVTAKCEDDGKPRVREYRFSNQKLGDLGLEFTDVRRSLYKTVICLQHRGHVPIIVPRQRASLLLMEQLVVSLPGFFSSHHFRPVFFRRLTIVDFFRCWFLIHRFIYPSALSLQISTFQTCTQSRI
ncbi:cinnamoyl-CoA reductase 1 [Triticum aestivum]|uniref:cinnamoyl-CoA reductase 1 n=1 Tax=Triticum aestivum TaxID=4565 RepID=UPI001D01165F|nr:cinnamoyl-CoA reductase 1-like [Triticum aestivum]